jgi:HK97 family phage prohead protease
MTTTIERRFSAEIRASANGRKLEGYAAVFNVQTRIADWLEIIAPGAFSASLAGGRDVLALADHDETKVLARTASGALRLAEDTRGLAFDMTLPDTSQARDIIALVESRNAGGMSFGFMVPVGGEEWRGERRTLKRVDLYEISVVSAHPAYPSTTVHARNRHSARLAAARRAVAIAGANPHG